jgi:flagellar biosynthesis/type III secretory pathway M-ring protein FliF/YscJ
MFSQLFTQLKTKISGVFNMFVGLVMAVLVIINLWLFLRNKKLGETAVLGETKGEDDELIKQQTTTENEIRKIETQDGSTLTPAEKAARWNDEKPNS